MKVHTPAIGYAGGKAGRNGGNRLDGRDLPGKTTVSLARGESIDIRLSGGGGMFDPFTRPAQAVVDAVEAGVVPPPGALPDSGVVLTEDAPPNESDTPRPRAPRAASHESARNPARQNGADGKR